MQRLFLPSFFRFLIFFLLYSFLVFSTVSSPSVMTSLSALSVLLLMYSLRFLISSSTVCQICRSPLPPILRGRYSLSMSLCGCRVRWAVMSFLVLRSRSSSSAIVQSTMPAVYLITGTAQLLIAWIVFPPFSLDFSILRTLLVYSADVCFFT